jgi:poly(A) polymerase/tRNA nucleotidyltransferase (CCA-adding enzyme)
MTIPEWQRAILDRGELYVVGGAVRDEMLGITGEEPEVDYLVRGIPPDELETILRRFGGVELVGKSFGVHKFSPERSGKTIDIAYPRREWSLGPGHREFAVEWDWQLEVEDDLRRRDFSINAMARDVRDGRLIDPCGGRRDLEGRILRAMFAGAFEEDPLRILRGVRFTVRFGLAVDPATRQAMEVGAPLLNTLSAERVQEELTKTLTQCERPSGAFLMMREIGALRQVLPELDRCAGVEQNEYHPDDVFVHSIKTCDCAPRDNLAVRWAALLHDVGKVDMKQTVSDEKLGDRVVFYGHQFVSADAASRILKRLRYSNTFVKKVEHLIRHHMFDYEPAWKASTVRRFIRRIREENLDDLFALRRADAASRDPESGARGLDELQSRIRHELQSRHTIRVEDLAIDGRDVIREGAVPAGPEVGAILAELLEAVLEDPGLNERETLLELVRRRRGRARDH